MFEKKTSLLISPIFGASSLAAPEALQGIRVFPFQKVNLESQSEYTMQLTAKISKR